MRLFRGSIVALGLAVALSPIMGAQGAQTPQDEKDKAVAGGGITAPGWHGTVDAASVAQGSKITDSKFAAEAGGFHIITGPAANYWNPANTASGDYTVSATFHEPKYQNLNDHPHPYGVFIAGAKMGTPAENLLYCSAYGNGTFIVRGFGPAPFSMGGRRPTANDAIHKAAAIGQPVDQTIALSVKGGRVECSVNGTVVAGYDRAELVGAGKLDGLDGVYGIRTAHNVDFTVTGLKKN